ncbi:restriction endonuclease subunit S [Aliarcobacter butzleri]|uniref:restriction endonuclease subunit S n=1 Tax=Aliarcobacter butzleri TaxID=28197 RepID=UPI002B24ABA8|nr:restriction endonuclease subunit S [Aliarcobacter butzleri]
MSNLPKDWELKTLGELVSILTDYTANGSFASLKENVTYFNEPNFAALVRTTDLKKKEFKPERFTDKRGYEFLKKSALYGGEILMANVGSIGEVYIVPEVDFPMTLAPNMYLIKYNDNLINTYAYYFMNSSIFINQLLSKIASTTLQAVNKANFKSIRIPLPPLEEQKKIADILSTVDKKIAFVEENINATEELKKGLMQKLLTEGIGHTEFKDSKLGRIPESWEIIELGKHIKLMGGYAFKSQDSTEQGVKWLKIANVGIQEIKWEQNSYLPINFIEDYSKFLLQTNDIVLAMTRPILNNKLKIAKINDNDLPALLNQRVGKFVFDSKVYSEFMYYLFQHIDFVKILMLKILGTDPPNVGSEQIESINIVFPPLEEQKQIAEILSTVDNKLENLKEKKQSFEELKKGLMQKLLTGEVRV